MDPRLLEGFQFFNQGRYFECHEVIEELWLETSPLDLNRDLYKGVIQAAAAIYQFDRGVLSGALGLYRSSVKYLTRYKDNKLGLNTEKLIGDLSICFAKLESAGVGCAIKRDAQFKIYLEYTT